VSAINHWPIAAVLITAMVCFTLIVLGVIQAFPWQRAGELDDYEDEEPEEGDDDEDGYHEAGRVPGEVAHGEGGTLDAGRSRRG
jgi:hypothetical protein